jgi:hypothetical protein
MTTEKSRPEGTGAAVKVVIAKPPFPHSITSPDWLKAPYLHFVSCVNTGARKNLIRTSRHILQEPPVWVLESLR